MAPYLVALNRPADVVYTPEGLFAGKALIWGNGEIESSYGILFIHEIVAMSILEDDEEGCAALVHELAHFEENLLLKTDNENKFKGVKTDDYEGLCSCYAGCVFGEFFAEFAAAPYYRTKEKVDSHLDLTIQMIKGSKERLGAAVQEFRETEKIDILWGITLEELSRLFNQFGRTLGLLQGLKETGAFDLADEFFAKVDCIDGYSWEPTLRELDTALASVMEIAYSETFNVESLSILYDFIEEGFFVAGFLLERQDSHLRVRLLPR
jgi:hypothetical protein